MDFDLVKTHTQIVLQKLSECFANDQHFVEPLIHLLYDIKMVC